MAHDVLLLEVLLASVALSCSDMFISGWLYSLLVRIHLKDFKTNFFFLEIIIWISKLS